MPLSSVDWASHIQDIAHANLELGNLCGSLKAIVNPSVLLSPLSLREAVLSSKIEGTQATLQEVLFYEASPDDSNPKLHDIQEVVNYRKALAYVIEALKEKPMNLNTIREMHRILMSSVRGKNQSPGEFRRDLNWIGPKGSSMEQAYFIPPSPIEMNKGLDNFEKYWHASDKDRIVQLAIIHAQFEILHPFRDGNGRIGRAILPIFLVEHGLMDQPVFYFSEYLESFREEYYSSLRRITDENNWNQWISFFLKGFAIQAKAIRSKADRILKLYDAMKREIYSLGTTYALPVLDALFTMPIFSSTEFAHYTGMPKTSANRFFTTLVEKGILVLASEGQGSRASTYQFSELIQIVDANLAFQTGDRS